MIIDPQEATGKTWDLCVVGTGPVGMALALEFEALGREVLVLESGNVALNGPAQNTPAAQASRAAIADDRRHAPMEIAVCRALGGTSWTWGGRCVPYDDVDFLDRSFVPDSHWPVTHDEIRPWYKVATKYMLCGGDRFEISYGRKLTDGLTVDFVERWATESRLILEHREKLLKSQQIKLSLNSTVTGFGFSADGKSVENLRVVTPAGPIQIKAKSSSPPAA